MVVTVAIGEKLYRAGMSACVERMPTLFLKDREIIRRMITQIVQSTN